MSAEKGSAFLLKVGDGATPPAYATVAGLRTTQLSVNGEAVNVTTKDNCSTTKWSCCRATTMRSSLAPTLR